MWPEVINKNGKKSTGKPEAKENRRSEYPQVPEPLEFGADFTFAVFFALED